jgi:hypothetical protein
VLNSKKKRFRTFFLSARTSNVSIVNRGGTNHRKIACALAIFQRVHILPMRARYPRVPVPVGKIDILIPCSRGHEQTTSVYLDTLVELRYEKACKYGLIDVGEYIGSDLISRIDGAGATNTKNNGGDLDTNAPLHTQTSYPRWPN